MKGETVELGPSTLAKFTLRDLAGLLIVACSVVGVYYAMDGRLSRLENRVDGEHAKNADQDSNNEKLSAAIGNLNENIQKLTVAVARLETKLEERAK